MPRPAAWRSAAIGGSAWLLPVLIIALIYFSPKHIVSASTAVTGLAALCLVAIAARWPDRSLIVLIVLLPFTGLILAKLWAWGVPTSIVRHLSAWKEALALGVVVAGARNFIASGRRADALDRLALAFVAVALLYMGFQHTIIPSAPSSSSIRLLGFREDAGFVLLLLGARHAPLPANFLERVGKVVLIVAVVVTGIGIFEALDSTAWNRFVVKTIQYTHYEVGVLHTTAGQLLRHPYLRHDRRYADHSYRLGVLGPSHARLLSGARVCRRAGAGRSRPRTSMGVHLPAGDLCRHPSDSDPVCDPRHLGRGVACAPARTRAAAPLAGSAGHGPGGDLDRGHTHRIRHRAYAACDQRGQRGQLRHRWARLRFLGRSAGHR